MRIFITTAWILLSLTLPAGSIWAYTSNVEIWIDNNDGLSHEVDIEYDIDDGNGAISGSTSVTVDGGSDYEFTKSVDALFFGGTDTFTVYINWNDLPETMCQTTLTVETQWFFAVLLDECSLSATDLTTNCSVETSTSGTTCQLTFTISE